MDLFYVENDSKILEWSDHKRLLLEYTDWITENNYVITLKQNLNL